ncbi:class I SAM-dependent methyltransferase [Geodermatophilus sp. YIM 151500]|uniref:class I SAM-dependent methyltransferase n=1 Tax=Geodermatophilus sp. YIM 151500 TaxID=2984531 RepID=UPI0021E4A89C|nr:class I SAM-dependent methyltransferase [Geodermatophilus sp. YIM 151500]MCV2490942.1 class I SAM-dependent methyltransferase [Geodermatophilus sp. YIM 151500]
MTTTTTDLRTPDSTIPDAARVDETRVEAFAGALLTDLAGAATTVMTVIGDRLGLFAAMTGAGPLTAAELAASTRLHPRLVTKWLAAMTVSSYVTHHPDAGTYELPAEHAMVLSLPGSPAYVVGAAEIVAGQYATLAALEEAFRGDGGIDYDVFPPSMFGGVERFFRTAYTHQLATTWFPAVDGLVDRLEAGARVADVGCGRGESTLQIAAHWPACTVTGFDIHHPSVVAARAKAIEAGRTDVAFRTADATVIGPGPFDVVVFFDALHDMGDPPAALRRARERLVDGGIVVAVEPWSLDRLEDGIGNPSVRIDYSCSTSVCTPGSLGQPGRYGLGTQGGPARRLALLTEAGFRDARLAVDDGVNLVLTAVR